jgi:hypothetical protein
MAGIETTNTGQETAEQFHATAEHLKERVEERFGERKGAVSRQIAGLANALRTTAEQCDRQADTHQIAGYARHAADGVEQIGQVLDRKNLSEMLVELERVSRERPLLVGAAALAAGLLGVRLTRTAVSVHRADTRGETRAGTEMDPDRTRLDEELIIQSDGGI